MSREVVIKLPELHAGQRRIVNKASRFNVLMCGRRYGKTTFGIERAIDKLIDGQPVGWFAPTYAYLLQPWWELHRRLGSAVSTSNKQERQMRLVNGATLDFWSLDKDDAGRSRFYGLVVIDEGGIVKDLSARFNESIRPTLTDLRGSAYFLGTPKGRGDFFRYFRKGQQGDPGWAAFHGETADNPYMDMEEVETAKRELPGHVFDHEYRGIPADDAGNPFGIEAIDACVSDLSQNQTKVFGIDLARAQDWTVIVGMDDGARVTAFHRFQLPWNEQVERIKSIVGGTPCLVDATGVGDAVTTMLSNAGVYVEPFVFTSKSKQDLMRTLQIAIQTKDIGYPESEIAEELRTFEYQISGNHVRYSAPSGLHDDCVMALALALRKTQTTVPSEVKVWA